jgi:hypothetical protein
MSKILIGCDPEVFLQEQYTGKYISAVGLVGGTKEKPRAFGPHKGFAIHEDNVAVEYNIPAAANVDEFVEFNHIALEEAKKVASDAGCVIATVDHADFTPDQLQSKGALEFGCNPDFNAWKLMPNPSPVPPASLRTAGGHIHIGFDGTTRDKIALVRCLDIFLGIPLNLMEPNSKRNQLYGSLGACRMKDYGVEYRVPSNIWIRSEEMVADIYQVVYEVTKNLKVYMKAITVIGEKLEDIVEQKDYRNSFVVDTIQGWLPYPSERIYEHLV